MESRGKCYVKVAARVSISRLNDETSQIDYASAALKCLYLNCSRILYQLVFLLSHFFRSRMESDL